MDTISMDAMKAVANLCNQIVLVEYEMILGYPRLIDHLTQFEKIKDKEILDNLDRLGKDSLGHFSRIDRLMAQFGIPMKWTTNLLPRIVDPIHVLNAQLNKEREALELYETARKIVINSKKEAKPRGLISRLFGREKDKEESVISADEVIFLLERHKQDEGRHIRLVEDSIATLKALRKK